MTVAYEYVHVHVSTLLFCVDVLITQYFLKKQSAYRNRGLRGDFATDRRIREDITINMFSLVYVLRSFVWRFLIM